MVCNRCIMVVRQELENMKLHPLHEVVGEVELKKFITTKQEQELNKKYEYTIS